MLFRKWQIHPVGSKGQIKEKHLFQYSPYWHCCKKLHSKILIQRRSLLLRRGLPWEDPLQQRRSGPDFR